MKKTVKYAIAAVLISGFCLLSSERADAQKQDVSLDMDYLLGNQGAFNVDRTMENLLIDAVFHFEAGTLSSAREILQNIIKIHPDNDAAHYYMGLIALAVNDEEVAEMSLLRAVQLDSTNFWYRHRLAYLYGITDRQEQMIEIYNGLLKDWPKRSELYYDLTGAYVSLNRLDEALETIDQIETVSGRSEASVMARFHIMCGMNRQEEAYEMLEDYNKAYSSPQVLTVLGDYNLSMYKDSTALANYEEALDLMPNYEPALIGRAEVLRMTGRYAEYLSALKWMAANPDIDVAGKCEYFRVVFQGVDANFMKNFQNDLDEVVVSCLEVHPADSSVVDLAGMYYYSTMRNEEARKWFKLNVDNYPDALKPTYTYAGFLVYERDFEELAEFSREAFEKFPTVYDFLDMEIYANYSLKDYKKVVETCLRVIMTKFDATAALSAYSTLGDVSYLLGDSKKAYESYEKALKINPDYLPVLNNYAYYLSVEGKKLKKAAEMSLKTIEAEPDNATYLDTYAWILHLQGKSEEAKAYFKHAMLYGGKDSAVIMDHYGDVLFALGEYDLAFLYWNQALAKDTEGEIEGLEEKIEKRREEVNSRK